MGEAAGYYRHPAVSGATIVFVCQDDLWTVPAGWGASRPPRSSAGVATFPVFSPDGRHVAFTAREEGPAEAYALDADGGAPRKLTSFGSMFTTTVGWRPDGGAVLVATD